MKKRGKLSLASATTGAIAAKAQYDAVAPDAKKRRREARIDTAGETGSDSRQLPPMTRLAMIALVRDACRNFSSCRAMLKQLGLNTVGTEYKLRIKSDDAAAKPAQDFFNKVWARQCDFRGDLHLFDINRLLVQSVARDGDAGLLFDRDLRQTGRLVTWESDQICTPSPLPAGAASCHDGVMLDSLGREIGYFVHPGYGRSVVPLAEGTVFARNPEDESANMFRLLRVPWRLNQRRGTSDLFSCVADLLDVYEMRAKELQSAKVAASMGGVVKKKNPPPGSAMSDPRLDPYRAGLAAAATPAPAPAPTQYKRLESLVGGYFEYLADDDEFELLDNKRPNVNGIPFAQHVIKSAGWASGMAACYSSGEAQASYTAFRGEMIMTWVMFRYWHKWLERYIQDWQAIRAVRWAITRGLITPFADDSWTQCLAWQHPKMPSVNPLIDQQTFLAALKNGATNLEEELGPGWRDTVEELISELDMLRTNNVPHAIFETKSGGLQSATASAPTPQDPPTAQE